MGKPDGFWVAAEILDMRLFTDKDQPEGVDPEVIAAGRDLLEIVDFRELGRSGDHHVGSLIACCLKGPDAVATARHLCRRFMQAIAANEIHAYGHDDLIGKLFKVQPVMMLDSLFGGTATERKIGQNIIEMRRESEQRRAKSFRAKPARRWSLRQAPELSEP